MIEPAGNHTELASHRALQGLKSFIPQYVWAAESFRLPYHLGNVSRLWRWLLWELLLSLLLPVTLFLMVGLIQTPKGMGLEANQVVTCPCLRIDSLSPSPGGGAESFLASPFTQDRTLFGVLLSAVGLLS